MKNIDTNELIDNLREDVLSIIRQVETHFKPLPNDALTYKPSVKSWSILECLEHTNITNKHYHEQIRAQLQNQKATATQSYSGGVLGNYFTKMMKPRKNKTVPNKMKTIGRFYPVISLQAQNHHSIIDVFLEDQRTLLDLLEQARRVNLAKIKIKSALGGWLMFKLGDAFRFMIAHSERHMLQAINVLDEYHTLVNESRT